MENASQALMIAAGVLIGILILSLGVYLFHVFGGYINNTEAEVAEKTLNQFNDKYLRYHELNQLTIQDIITVKNNALQNNVSYSGYQHTSGIANGSNNYIDVYIGTTWILNKTDEELLISELENNVKIPRYTCKVEISSDTGRVFKVTFTRNS